MNGMPHGGPFHGPRPNAKDLREKPKKITVKYVLNEFTDTVKRLFYIYSLVWQSGKGGTFLITFLTVITGLQPIASAYILKGIMDVFSNVLQDNKTVELRTFTVFALLNILLLFSLKINSVVNFVINRLLGDLVTRNIKLKIITKSKEVDLGSYDDPDFYSKLENAEREANNKPLSILLSSLNLVSSLIRLFGFIAIIASFNVFASLAIIAATLPGAVISFIYRKKNFKLMFRHSKERRKMNYFSGILVNKDLIKEIKLFGMGDFLVSNYNNVFVYYYKKCKKLILSQGLWTIITAIASAAATGWVYIRIGILTFRKILSIGDFSLYTSAIFSIENSIRTIIETSAVLYEGTLFIDNLKSFLSEEPAILAANGDIEPEFKMQHSIEFKNVSFCYPKTSKKVLNNISFKIEKGENIALVGLNGSGKTTLLKLLMRLYDPQEGKILLDGKDIRKYDVNKLYKLFGTVFQDFGRYAFSVKENIALGRLYNMDNHEAIKKAAQKSRADIFIEKLSGKYDTPLTRFFEPNGMELSIGQWQKIAIARAFFREADILVFDEPSSALDAKTEYEIFKQFEELADNKTAIFVSHRLSSATFASKVILLENGEIEEMGPHEELMEKNGKYAELFRIQASRYTENKKELSYNETTKTTQPVYEQPI